jgi:hypothetical protein
MYNSIIHERDSPTHKVCLIMIWNVSFGLKLRFAIKNLKSPVKKLRFFKQGESRCKTGFLDLKDSVAVWWTIQRSTKTFRRTLILTVIWKKNNSIIKQSLRMSKTCLFQLSLRKFNCYYWAISDFIFVFRICILILRPNFIWILLGADHLYRPSSA